MTTEERLDRMEHVLAGHIEQAKKDYEENRRIWREFQSDRDAIWRRMEERDKEWRAMMAERDRERHENFEAMRKESDKRGKELDERVDKLVSAIGELIRRMPVPSNGKLSGSQEA